MPKDDVPGFSEINRMIHEPARLAILTVLSACASADFTFLQRATGLSKGNLSVQLTRLEEAGFLTIDKVVQKKRTLTTAELSELGRSEIGRYWETMKEIERRGTLAR